MNKILKITMPEGKWMVDIFSKTNDSGQFDLVHPNTCAEISVNGGEMYGFRYSVSGKQGTQFTIELDDMVLVEGEIDKSETAKGSGVI